jgi:hypothetical protein
LDSVQPNPGKRRGVAVRSPAGRQGGSTCTLWSQGVVVASSAAALVCVALVAAPATATPPNIPSYSTAVSRLNALTVAAESHQSSYNRDLCPGPRQDYPALDPGTTPTAARSSSAQRGHVTVTTTNSHDDQYQDDQHHHRASRGCQTTAGGRKVRTAEEIYKWKSVNPFRLPGEGRLQRLDGAVAGRTSVSRSPARRRWSSPSPRPQRRAPWGGR